MSILAEVISRVTSTYPKHTGNIMFLAEAPGKNEALYGAPLIGRAGEEFDRMLLEADIEREACHIANIMEIRPPDNDFTFFCLPKKQALAKMPKGQPYPWAAAKPGAYIDPDFLLPELARLHREVEKVKPNIIVPLGNVAMAIVCGLDKITKYRGVVRESMEFPGIKVIPTYHPAYILRNWKERSITILDLIKIKEESEFPEIRIAEKQILIPETVEDVRQFFSEWATIGSLLSVDIETKHNLITCICFAPNSKLVLVIPFVDRRTANYTYWDTFAEELQVWSIIKAVLGDPLIRKVGQNFLYDMQWLLSYGIPVRGTEHDTMILHHALHPEVKKGLGFLGSIYAKHMPAWKTERPRGQWTTKLDE